MPPFVCSFIRWKKRNPYCLLSTRRSAKAFSHTLFHLIFPKSLWTRCCLLYVQDNETVTRSWHSLPKLTGLVSHGFQSPFLPGLPCLFKQVVNGILQVVQCDSPITPLCKPQRRVRGAAQDPAMPRAIFTLILNHINVWRWRIGERTPDTRKSTNPP